MSGGAYDVVAASPGRVANGCLSKWLCRMGITDPGASARSVPDVPLQQDYVSGQQMKTTDPNQDPVFVRTLRPPVVGMAGSNDVYGHPDDESC